LLLNVITCLQKANRSTAAAGATYAGHTAFRGAPTSIFHLFHPLNLQIPCKTARAASLVLYYSHSFSVYKCYSKDSHRLYAIAHCGRIISAVNKVALTPQERQRCFKVPENHIWVILTSAATDACCPMCDTQQTAPDHVTNLLIRSWSFDEIPSA